MKFSEGVAVFQRHMQDEMCVTTAGGLMNPHVGQADASVTQPIAHAAEIGLQGGGEIINLGGGPVDRDETVQRQADCDRAMRCRPNRLTLWKRQHRAGAVGPISSAASTMRKPQDWIVTNTYIRSGWHQKASSTTGHGYVFLHEIKAMTCAKTR